MSSVIVTFYTMFLLYLCFIMMAVTLQVVFSFFLFFLFFFFFFSLHFWYDTHILSRGSSRCFFVRRENVTLSRGHPDYIYFFDYIFFLTVCSSHMTRVSAQVASLHTFSDFFFLNFFLLLCGVDRLRNSSSCRI